ncbi:MAG: type IV secretion system DNA-binding domain-containing protein [Chloroflexi bacterium]|nr:type IV secretion system DNA-binding domain-containing protein [Chloroflexota bacterium]
MNPLTPLKRLFGSDKANDPVLLSITPPRTGERTMLGVENMLQAIAVPEPFSLEIAGNGDGVRLLVRCIDSQTVRGQVGVHYPQARVSAVNDADDPLTLDEGEEAWTTSLTVRGPEYVPLRVFRDDDLLDEGSDPMLALIGALSAVRPKERVVARLVLKSMGPDWSEAYQVEAEKPRFVPRPTPQEGQVNHGEVIRLMLLAGGAFVGLRTWQYWQDGDVFKAIALAGGAVLGALTAAIVWTRLKREKPRIPNTQIVLEKVSRTAFQAEVQLIAVVPKKGGRRRASELLTQAATAYGHYNNPVGAKFDVGKLKLAPEEFGLKVGGGMFAKRNVLGVREVASLWHPLGSKDEAPQVDRSGSKVLTPSARALDFGAHVGSFSGDSGGEIRFPGDLLRRHHLYVARTRMGKSTLMQHIVAHKLREKAIGRDDDAIVVIDPHVDLIASLLEHVPESLADQVRLVDLADPNGAPGINLLDSRIFTDRDRTADSVVRIAKGLWDQWGPRMQSILEQVVKTLHEANERMPEDKQYTILDGLALLAPKNGSFRSKMLKRVDDIHLLEWWARDFTSWHKQYRSEALAPVQTRLSYYATSKKARAILGQRRSTIDIRRTIRDGGILLVSTAQGAAGRDVSALVGSSLLNLVDAVIREQGGLHPSERRGVLVVVDEMQSMPGVDYESMLSELGKFGASFVLATQSLSKLDDLSPTMRDSLLANVGCLAVFQVASSDARQLVGELGTDRVTQDDITSLPVHQCYVRATVGTERLPTFSMEVRKPGTGNGALAQRIRAGTVDYTTGHDILGARDASLERLVEQYRKTVDDADSEEQSDIT